MSTPAPFDPLASDAPLIVYLDFKSPYAFLSVEPTRDIAKDLGIAVDWRPLTLDIPSYLGSAKLGGSLARLDPAKLDEPGGRRSPSRDDLVRLICDDRGFHGFECNGVRKVGHDP